MSCREEASGRTQDLLERPAWEQLGVPLEKPEEVAGESIFVPNRRGKNETGHESMDEGL